MNCARCGGPKEAHFEPDECWPNGICMCAAPDMRPCGCSGYVDEIDDAIERILFEAEA